MTTIIGETLFLLPALIVAILLSPTPPNHLAALSHGSNKYLRSRLTALQRPLVCALPLAAMGRLRTFSVTFRRCNSMGSFHPKWSS
jgi:hypothetical protein